MEDQTRKEVLERYGEGESCDSIAEDLDFHKSTIHRKVKDAGINRSRSEAARMKTLSEEHKNKISEGLKNSEKKLGSPRLELKDGYSEPTEELAYIAGVLLGDGYIVSGDGVGLETIDKEFADKFAGYCEKQFGLEPSVYEKEPDSMKDWRTGETHEKSRRWLVRVNSMNLRDYAEELQNPGWIEGKSKDTKLCWLRGLWDSDGCFNHKSHQVYLYNKNEDIINSYERVLREILNIETEHYKKESGVYVSYFGGLSQVETFYKEVQPTIKRKRKRFQELLSEQNSLEA